MRFARKMTKLGKALSRIKDQLVIHEDITLLGIKKGRYSPHKFIYDHFVKCWYRKGQDIACADVTNLDWYLPQYASHHTKKEVTEWFREAKFKEIRCIQPKGWEHSGYFISGKKR